MYEKVPGNWCLSRKLADVFFFSPFFLDQHENEVIIYTEDSNLNMTSQLRREEKDRCFLGSNLF